MSKKKIAFLISTLAIGGAERTVSNLSLMLPDNRWDIDLIINHISEVELPYKGNIIDLGITRKGEITDYIYQIRIMLKRILFLKKYKNKKECDVCISFMDSANIANLLFTNNRVKTIVSIRNSLAEHQKKFAYRHFVLPLSRRLYRKADAIVAVTEKNAEEIRETFRLEHDRVIAINNGYNLAEIEDKAKEQLTEEEEKWKKDATVVFITAGRLVEQKAQWNIIRAMSIVRKKYSTAKLLILGEGDLQEYLQALISDLKLDENVRLCGNVKNPYKIFYNSDIFLLPSMYEGYPNALAEAMCCGLPSIITDFETGAHEIFQYDGLQQGQIQYKTNYGIVVPLCDGKKKNAKDELTYEELIIADAMLEMIENIQYREQCSKNALEHSKQFSIYEILQQWTEVMEV